MRGGEREVEKRKRIKRKDERGRKKRRQEGKIKIERKDREYNGEDTRRR